jgi:hypothetical protein
MENVKKDLLEAIAQSDKVLVGIGGEWENADVSLYDGMGRLLSGSDYFIVSTCEGGAVFEGSLDRTRITAPFYEGDAGEEQWKRYNSWLQGTLNHSLVILELGEGFDAPNVIRWPFENIVLVNNGARLYRVNGKFYNVPDNIAGKSHGIHMDSVEFAKELIL